MKLFEFQYLKRLDLKMILVIACLMFGSLLVMSEAHNLSHIDEIVDEPFWTPLALNQLKWFIMSFAVYILAACFDYNKLREWAWFLYVALIVSLIGLFFTTQSHNVYRWYRIPGLFYVQPSELAKLGVVISLSWFLEKQKHNCHLLKTAMQGLMIMGIPFMLILLQPDLGSALVLYPITLVMFYFADIYPPLIKFMIISALVGFVIMSSILLGLVSHDAMRPVATTVMREYQYQRLAPDDYHRKASASAMAIGGLIGKGWRRGDFTSGGWLPAPQTDSVFPNFGEHYGFLGLCGLLFLFYMLIYYSFKVSTVAKDHFGQLLSTGVAVYLAMHILINIGMMCGFLPITGVPLVLITYGGSSSIVTMAALGILQSIYSRRFMF